ncbi:MAG: hypothetical protein H7287_01065, partial [Thermoleophilia bacterium]|nr:hypothetical protein [Thermoleophilia bacterium]
MGDEHVELQGWGNWKRAPSSTSSLAWNGSERVRGRPWGYTRSEAATALQAGTPEACGSVVAFAASLVVAGSPVAATFISAG